jgi:hypothetical protein
VFLVVDGSAQTYTIIPYTDMSTNICANLHKHTIEKALITLRACVFVRVHALAGACLPACLCVCAYARVCVCVCMCMCVCVCVSNRAAASMHSLQRPIPRHVSFGKQTYTSH